jgi:protein-S-isoprenylcysteine O-methyltransferase Ste14
MKGNKAFSQRTHAAVVCAKHLGPHFRNSIVDLIGKSPVPVVVLVIGKLALLLCVFFFIVKFLRPDAMLYDSLATRAVGIVLYAMGLTIVLAALVQLGQSTAVGLPERNTTLKTHGLYRFTRNPIYVGGFITCIGSCFYSIHLLNFFLCAIVIGIHLRIVRREGEFLEKRFGQQWLDYKQHIPRFVRITRHTP